MMTDYRSKHNMWNIFRYSRFKSILAAGCLVLYSYKHFYMKRGVCHDRQENSDRGTVVLWDIYGKGFTTNDEEGFVGQAETDEFSEKPFGTKKRPGFLLHPPLG